VPSQHSEQRDRSHAIASREAAISVVAEQRTRCKQERPEEATDDVRLQRGWPDKGVRGGGGEGQIRGRRRLCRRTGHAFEVVTSGVVTPRRHVARVAGGDRARRHTCNDNMHMHMCMCMCVVFQLIQARLIPGWLSRLNGTPERSLLRFQHTRSSFPELPVRVINPELALPHGATRKPT